jgi:NhaP-type Na+/H+ or K+/H+ antiporter
MIAASPGLSFGDSYVVGLLFLGVAVFAAVGALSHQQERAFSASVIYLCLGVAAAVGIEAFGIAWVDPLQDSNVLEKMSELAVVVALFATGLKLERELEPRKWRTVARLLLVAMPVTIAGVALFGVLAMGMSLGAAIVLGAILAPTDPVLAGDIGVGPPGDEEEREPNFSITGEAGLNDGLAFPFLLLGIILAGSESPGWLGAWLLEDVLYAIVVAVAIGAALGYGLAAAAVRLRDRGLLAHELDGWLAVAAVLVIYGATEIAGAYGFLAAFVGGVAFRRYEHGHEYNARVHAGAETAEKFGELALILLLGSSLTLAGLQAPALVGWLLVPALLVLIRPASVVLALTASGLPRPERAFIAWFGVRGIGSLYYVAVAIGTGALAQSEARTLFWTTAVCVVTSVLVHGITSTPLSKRWLPVDKQPGHHAGDRRAHRLDEKMSKARDDQGARRVGTVRRGAHND